MERVQNAEKESDEPVPVIALGREHVSLIVKGPGLSPGLSEGRSGRQTDPTCHLTGLAPRHGESNRLWSELIAMPHYFHGNGTESVSNPRYSDAALRSTCHADSLSSLRGRSYGDVFSARRYMCYLKMFDKKLSGSLDWFIPEPTG